MHHSHRVRAGLWVAVGLLIAQAAMAATPPLLATSTDTLAVRRDAGALQKFAAPADHVLTDLQAGLRKLQRLCALPSSVPKASDPSGSERLIPLQDTWAAARVTLNRSQAQTAVLLEQFERHSRTAQTPWCRLSPAWLPICMGFRQDQQLLESVRQVSHKVFSEAGQRLEVYEQYAVLEANQCTSKGFTQRLWQTEETYLWPLVTGTPQFLERVLQQAP